jgi:maleylpyruvate isomerase
VDSAIGEQLAQIQDSTDRLLGTARVLTDAQAHAASLLPGWTRGHVLTHVARNADGLRNLLAWAGTGTETPMYPSEAARDEAIAAGAGRPAAELARDLQESAAAFSGAAAGLPAGAWAARVERRGETFPARAVLAFRLSELEIHHVDLAAGYTPADWPDGFLAAALPRAARSFAGRPDMAPAALHPDGWAEVFPVGPATPNGPPVAVHGPPGALLGWLIGRADGTELHVAGASALPVPPPWR